MYISQRLHLSSNSILCVLFLSLGAVSACAPPQPTSIKVEQEDPIDQIPVSLPPLINLDELMPKLKNLQGHFLIPGLRMRTQSYLDQTLELTGYVVEKFRCKRLSKTRKKCEKPRIWLSDTQGGEPQMQVIFDDAKSIKKKVWRRLKLNKQYVFEGQLKTKAKAGYIDSKGLLIYQSHR